MRQTNMIIKKSLFLLAICSLFSLNACTGALFVRQKLTYYSDKSVYISSKGTVTYIGYNEERSVLYFSFSELQGPYSDNTFKIVGDNLGIAQKRGIDTKISVGDQIEFLSAPRYFGDGYVMPIVELSANGDKLLDFEEGYSNLLKWIKEGNY